MSSQAHGTHAAEHHHHVMPLKLYYAVYGALLVLTVLTVLVSYLGLGGASIPVAMTVAIAKASLVTMYFMHLKYDERFNILVFVGSVLFMIIFFVFTMLDLTSRDWILQEQGNFVIAEEQIRSGEAPQYIHLPEPDEAGAHGATEAGDGAEDEAGDGH